MQGMEYLHNSPLKFHGMLRSSNCLLNFRWTLKISDVSFSSHRVKEYVTDNAKYTGQRRFSHNVQIEKLKNNVLRV